MAGAETPLDRARELVDRAQADPRRVAEAAQQIAHRFPDSPAHAVALWASGLATRELGDTQRSRRELEAAVRLAAQLEMLRDTAQIRESLAFTLFLLGEHDEALAQTELAAPHLRGGDAARLQMQRGLILQRSGRTDDALAAYRRALAGMSRAGDRLGEARLRINRSSIHTYRWDLKAAVADLQRAHELAVELDQLVLVAGCEHNLGFVEGRRGQIPDALRWFEQAQASYERAGLEGGLAAVLEADRAQLLLDVGLSEEAFAAAEKAATLLEEGGNAADQPEALLLAARAALANRQAELARELAGTAKRQFRASDRQAWEAIADYVAIRAQLALLLEAPTVSRPVARRLASEARRTSARLRDHGWEVESLHAHIIEARGHLAAGDSEAARRVLDGAASARRRGPIDIRLPAWHATAMLRSLDGNAYGARRALEAGLRLLEDRRAMLGATELRASAATHASDLVDFGVSLALDSDRPERLLRWVDTVRAGAIRLHPSRPPRDARLAADLTQLRKLEQESAEAALAGHTPDHAIQEKAVVERRIRDRARHHRGHARPALALQVESLQRRLGDRALVEFLAHRGQLYAVVVERSGVRRHDLGSVDGLTTLADQARFDISRLAYARGSALALEATEASLDDVGRSLDERVIAPLGVADSPLVVVPAGPLHGVPWRVLPSLRERVFSVVPSALSWLSASARRRPNGDRVLIVAGPDLDHAGREARQVAQLYGDAQRLAGRRATTEDVLAGLESSDSAHIIAHGEFRPDSPMFSSLRMVDGPLTVYDMERLRRVPTMITLPACDAAVTGQRPGEELLGLSAALLALGVRSLVVPQVPIPDAETPPIMRDFHRAMRAGAAPDQALADALAGAASDRPQQRAVAMSFVAMGA